MVFHHDSETSAYGYKKKAVLSRVDVLQSKFSRSKISIAVFCLQNLICLLVIFAGQIFIDPMFFGTFVINVCTLFHHSRFLFHLLISLYGWDVYPILLFCAVKNSCETYTWDHIFKLDGKTSLLLF